MIVDYGPTQLDLQIRCDLGWRTTRVIDVDVPAIKESAPRSLETSRDRLRAWLHHQMHRTLAGARMEPGVYRVRLGRETVADRWTGRAMAGCADRPEHVIDCGLYACPHRRP